jgi:hypothetical protein
MEFGNDSIDSALSKTEPKDAPKKLQEGYYKDFDRQATISSSLLPSLSTRLAVLNTATEILKTYRKPIEFSDTVSIAS